MVATGSLFAFRSTITSFVGGSSIPANASPFLATLNSTPTCFAVASTFIWKNKSSISATTLPMYFPQPVAQALEPAEKCDLAPGSEPYLRHDALPAHSTTTIPSGARKRLSILGLPLPLNYNLRCISEGPDATRDRNFASGSHLVTRENSLHPRNSTPGPAARPARMEARRRSLVHLRSARSLDRHREPLQATR